MTARSYDNAITVLHTHDPYFKVSIDRSVTPGNYKFKDMILRDGIVKLLSVRDGELFLDSFSLPESGVASNSKKTASKKDDSASKGYYDAPFKS